MSSWRCALGSVSELIPLIKYSFYHHLDISLDTVPRLLKQLLAEEQLKTYFRPGYRFRLIKYVSHPWGHQLCSMATVN